MFQISLNRLGLFTNHYLVSVGFLFDLTSCPSHAPKRGVFASMLSGQHRMQFVLALVVSTLLVAGAVVMTPLAKLPLPAVPGFLGASASSLIVINLLLASLLFSRGGLPGQQSAVHLGTAYFFAAAVEIPWLASFPGAFVATALVGSGATPVWMWCFVHTGFALAVIRFAVAKSGARASVPKSILFCIAASILLTMTATFGLPWLPSMLADGHTLFTGFGAFVAPTMLMIVSIALVLVLRRASESIGRLWLAVGLVAELFDIWSLYLGGTRYSLGWYLANVGGLFTSLVVLISALHDITILYRHAAEANELLASQALMDGLTGVANRRWLDEALPLEWRRAERARLPLSLIMIDVDFFKKFNDEYGHLAGDDCLRQVAGVLRATVRRAGDFVARYGGEEFVVLLPATDAKGAKEVANALQARLRALAIPHGASPLGVVTVSCGISTTLRHSDETHDELLRRADRNLYRAKQAGRNMNCGDTPGPSIRQETSASIL